jgi:hypothetical protein
MVVLASLKILYLFLYREYINHIHLNFFLLLPSNMCDHPLAWLVFHNIPLFVLGLYSKYKKKHVAFGLLNLTDFS